MQIVSAAGAKIPALGFGTYGMARGHMLRMIPEALNAGFRHIDTAQIYHNEAEVGECVEASGIARENLFLTTKVWVANYPANAFSASVDESLKKLRTDYIDLLLLHWPSDAVPLADQIGVLNAAVQSGKVRHIGVSNFNMALMAEAARLSEHLLVTNQFEYHPYLNQAPLIAASRNAGLAVTGYCGMAVGRVFTDPARGGLAARHRRPPPPQPQYRTDRVALAGPAGRRCGLIAHHKPGAGRRERRNLRIRVGGGRNGGNPLFGETKQPDSRSAGLGAD